MDWKRIGPALEEASKVGIPIIVVDTDVFESERERELVHVFKTEVDATAPKPSSELDGGRFWTRKEILDSIGKGVFTPNFEKEYLMLFPVE